MSAKLHAGVVDGLLALWDVMVNVHLQDVCRRRCNFQHTFIIGDVSWNICMHWIGHTDVFSNIYVPSK